MKKSIFIFLFCVLFINTKAGEKTIVFNFYGCPVSFVFNDENFVDFDGSHLSEGAIKTFYHKISQKNYRSILTALNNYRQSNQPDDWFFYQLVRSMAEQISPKSKNYLRYTLYKWYFMQQSGYTPLLSMHNNMLLFFIQSNENVYNIPLRNKGGKQFVCLNYHDYGNNINFEHESFKEVAVDIPEGTRFFSYKINKLPDFDKGDYTQKELLFDLYNNEYRFNIKVNSKINKLFINYPTVDYENYFSIPFSKETDASLITQLKKYLKGKSVKDGVDYLMHFTRYAFVFEPDTKQFGSEKRLTAEQTLLYENSDCEDRVIFFFRLVKEIYNLPMIVLEYPQHITIAVNFENKNGKPIMYNGIPYYVCEPTPQKTDMKLGQLLPQLKNTPFEVTYAYMPNN